MSIDARLRRMVTRVKTHSFRMRSLLAAIAIFAVRCSATIIYNNGPSNLSDGANMTAYYVADDFVVASSANLEQVSWSSSADSDPYPQYSNAVDWAVLSDANGLPGSVLNSGSSPATFTDTGQQIQGTEEFQVGIALSPLVTVTRGTYWLSLSVDPNGNLAQGVYWDTTSDTTSETHGSVAMSSTSLSGPWSPSLSGSNGTDLAFVISGTATDQGNSGDVTPENATGGITFALLFSMAVVRQRFTIADLLNKSL